MTGSLSDVPAGDAWLGDAERRVQAGLRVAKRRLDWRLGRWTAKRAVAAWLDIPLQSVEILAAVDGAPEAWVDGAQAHVSVSLSHRGGRALAAVIDSPAVVGCDLELVEPRSGAFVREWLTRDEQRLVERQDGPDRELVANLLWCAKEAAAKVRREGLRLDVRNAVVELADGWHGVGGWRPLCVDWRAAGVRIRGWWSAEPRWVMTVATEPASEPPWPAAGHLD